MYQRDFEIAANTMINEKRRFIVRMTSGKTLRGTNYRIVDATEGDVIAVHHGSAYVGYVDLRCVEAVT